MKIQTIAIGCLLLGNVISCFGQAESALNMSEKIPTTAGTPTKELMLSVNRAATVLPSGNTVNGSIIALFDAKSHLFWWMHETSLSLPDTHAVRNDFMKSHSITVAGDQITCFTALSRSIWVRSSSAHYDSMSDGLKAIHAALPTELNDFELGKTSWFKRIPIANVTGQEFFYSKNIGDPPVAIKIEKVEHSGLNWILQVKNESNAIKTLIFDQDFNSLNSPTR